MSISAHVHAVGQDIFPTKDLREVRHIRTQVKDGAYTQSQRAGNFKRTDGVFHFVQDVVNI